MWNGRCLLHHSKQFSQVINAAKNTTVFYLPVLIIPSLVSERPTVGPLKVQSVFNLLLSSGAKVSTLWKRAVGRAPPASGPSKEMPNHSKNIDTLPPWMLCLWLLYALKIFSVRRVNHKLHTHPLLFGEVDPSGGGRAPSKHLNGGTSDKDELCFEDVGSEWHLIYAGVTL